MTGDGMAQQGERLTIILGDLRERIEAARGGDIAWRELSLSGKVRTLIEERLNQIERQPPSEKHPPAP